MNELEDITPEDSAAPVYLDPTPPEPVVEPSLTLEEQIAEQVALRQAGIAKLMALGLTEDEARAIAGI